MTLDSRSRLDPDNVLPLPEQSEPSGPLSWRLFRFGLAGFLSIGLNYLFTIGFHTILGLSEELSFALSLALLIIINFVVNRLFVFRASGDASAAQFGKFAISSVGFRFSEWLLFVALVNLGIDYRFALFITCVISFFAKFWFFRLFVFGKP
jgi:putative flippase GtrA